MKTARFRGKLFFLFLILFLQILLLVSPRITWAADHCPSQNITEDTTWTEEDMYEGKFDCSETDLVIDGAVLIIEVYSDSDFSAPFMDARSITYKNDGDLKVTIRERSIVSRQIQNVYKFVKNPYNVGQTVVTVGVGLQLLSFASLFYSGDVGLASIVGVLGQVLFGRDPQRDLWGVVYDSRNRKPIPFAIVRMFEADSENLLASTVTDLSGRYGFPVTQGVYRIEVEHDEYVFPSEIPGGDFLSRESNFYVGEDFRITEETSIDKSIPLDPKVYKFGLNLVFFEMLFKKLRDFVRAGNLFYILILFIINLLLTIVEFNVLNFIFCLFYFVLIIFKIVAKAKKPQAWGTVYNSKTSVPIPSAFVKLYEAEKRELVDTKITDTRGRFQFFVPPGDYLMLVSATGFKFPSSKVTEKKVSFYGGMMQIHTVTGALNIEVPIDPLSDVERMRSPFSA